MDWIGTIVVVLVVAVVVGLVLERRRRRTRLGGPSHAGTHASHPAGRGYRPGDVQQVDQRFGGFDA